MSILSYWHQEVDGIVFQNKPSSLNENLANGAMRLKKEVGRCWVSQDGFADIDTVDIHRLDQKGSHIMVKERKVTSPTPEHIWFSSNCYPNHWTH